MLALAFHDLAGVVGGQAASCPVVNFSRPSTVTQNGQSQSLDGGQAGFVQPGSFDVSQDAGKVTMSGQPGLGFGIVNDPGQHRFVWRDAAAAQVSGPPGPSRHALAICWGHG